MKRIIAALIIVTGCGDEPDDGVCIFRGSYDIGLTPRVSGCQYLSEGSFFLDEEGECSSGIDQLSLEGVWQRGFISCEPGDPVVKCAGFLNDANGCSWDLYMRRIVQP